MYFKAIHSIAYTLQHEIVSMKNNNSIPSFILDDMAFVYLSYLCVTSYFNFRKKLPSRNEPVCIADNLVLN